MTSPPFTSGSGGRGPTEFEGRNPDIRAAVMRYRAGDRRIEAGQSLIREGKPQEAIFYLAEGWLMFHIETEGGRRRILQFGLPGTLTGGSAGTTTYGVQALSEAVVSVIPQAPFETLVRENPQIGSRVELLAARPLSFGFEHMPDLTQHSAHERVAQLILELFIRLRAQWPNHAIEHMLLPLAREHVADATGLGYAETGDALQRLQTDGIAELRDQGIAILNPDELVDASGIDLGTMRAFLLS